MEPHEGRKSRNVGIWPVTRGRIEDRVESRWAARRRGGSMRTVRAAAIPRHRARPSPPAGPGKGPIRGGARTSDRSRGLSPPDLTVTAALPSMPYPYSDF